MTIDNNLSRMDEYKYIPSDRIKIFYADQSNPFSISRCCKEMGVEKFEKSIQIKEELKNRAEKS